MDDVVYAGFIRRWAALFLDSLIIAVPLSAIVIAIVMSMGLYVRESQQPVAVAQGLYFLLYFLLAPFYYAGMESSSHQATFGKRALGIKVTDYEGRRLSFGHALGRWSAASLSYLTCYIGFLMAAISERKRALHDMVAGTLIVDRWAYSEHPERQQRNVSGCLIAFVLGMLFIPFMAGILAAIAVPQFEDYAARAQVAEGMVVADQAKTAIINYRLQTGAFPTSNADAGLPAATSLSGHNVSRVDVGSAPGEITVTFSSKPPQHANAQLDGASMTLSPVENQGAVEWRCHSDNIKQKFCPRACICQ
jgi:uncharacterized RDD family membrane protein YckC/Tfp pilus assembly major pilin PilA